MDPAFSSLPATNRLELLTTRLVLSTYGEKSTVDIALPATVVAELPRLCCRWFNQAARAHSNGLRDASAYLDFSWEPSPASPISSDCRVAALWYICDSEYIYIYIYIYIYVCVCVCIPLCHCPVSQSRFVCAGFNGFMYGDPAFIWLESRDVLFNSWSYCVRYLPSCQLDNHACDYDLFCL